MRTSSVVVGICLAACGHPPKAAPLAAIELQGRSATAPPPGPTPTRVAAADSALPASLPEDEFLLEASVAH
jgi:hypothetical protein